MISWKLAVYREEEKCVLLFLLPTVDHRWAPPSSRQSPCGIPPARAWFCCCRRWWLFPMLACLKGSLHMFQIFFSLASSTCWAVLRYADYGASRAVPYVNRFCCYLRFIRFVVKCCEWGRGIGKRGCWRRRQNHAEHPRVQPIIMTWSQAFILCFVVVADFRQTAVCLARRSECECGYFSTGAWVDIVEFVVCNRFFFALGSIHGWVTCLETLRGRNMFIEVVIADEREHKVEHSFIFCDIETVCSFSSRSFNFLDLLWNIFFNGVSLCNSVFLGQESTHPRCTASAYFHCLEDVIFVWVRIWNIWTVTLSEVRRMRSGWRH